MKTRSFDRKAVKKVSPESCPIRTRGAKKGNKERKQKWIQRLANRRVFSIRGINSNVVKALETSAKKHDLSREEYLRQCLERIAYDDRALGSKYEQQLQKLFQCLEGQQKQLSLLIAGMEQVEESCCRLEDGLLEKESWSEESEGAIV